MSLRAGSASCSNCPAGTYSTPVGTVNLARSCGTAQSQACPASQSSTFPSYYASYANDGSATGILSHTNYDTNPWWSVNFGSPQAVGSGIIYGRTDCCMSRLNGFQIWVGNGTTYSSAANIMCYQATSFEENNPPYTHAFTCSVIGQYLFVVLPTTQYLTIEEIMIFPPQCSTCAAGTYSAPGISYRNLLLVMRTHASDDGRLSWQAPPPAPSVLQKLVPWQVLPRPSIYVYMLLLFRHSSCAFRFQDGLPPCRNAWLLALIVVFDAVSYDRIFVVHLVPDKWRPGWSGLQLKLGLIVPTKAKHRSTLSEWSACSALPVITAFAGYLS